MSAETRGHDRTREEGGDTAPALGAEPASAPGAEPEGTGRRSSVPPSADRLAPGCLLLLLLLAFGGALWVFRGFIDDLALAFVLVALSRPAFLAVQRRVGGRAWLAAVLVTLGIALVVLVPVVLLSISVVKEAIAAFDGLREWLASRPDVGWQGVVGEPVHRALGKLGIDLEDQALTSLVSSAGGYLRDSLLGLVGSWVNGALGAVFHFAIVLVLVAYLHLDGERLRRFVYDLSPLPDAEDELIERRFGEVARGIFYGNGLGSVVQGIFCGGLMAVLGLERALLWGTVMSVLAFLPLVGVSIVVLPVGAWLYATDRPGAAIVFVTLCMTFALFVENVVKTRLMGSQIRMHDVVLFLSILGGIASFGVLGLLYGPLLVAGFLTLSELWTRRYRERVAAWRDR